MRENWTVCGGTKCGAGRSSSLTGIDTYLSSEMIHYHSTHPDAAAILLSSKLNLPQKGNQNYKQFLYVVVFIRSVFISFITFTTPL